MATKREKIRLMCVNCGGNATKGSMKHPYCKKCFKKIFNDDYDKYLHFLRRTHG
jgi:reverse gyrase